MSKNSQRRKQLLAKSNKVYKNGYDDGYLEAFNANPYTHWDEPNLHNKYELGFKHGIAAYKKEQEEAEKMREEIFGEPTDA